MLLPSSKTVIGYLLVTVNLLGIVLYIFFEHTEILANTLPSFFIQHREDNVTGLLARQLLLPRFQSR